MQTISPLYTFYIYISTLFSLLYALLTFKLNLFMMMMFTLKLSTPPKQNAQKVNRVLVSSRHWRLLTTVLSLPTPIHH